MLWEIVDVVFADFLNLSVHQGFFVCDDDDGEGVSQSGPSRLRSGSVSVYPQQSGLCCLTVLRDSRSVEFSGHSLENTPGCDKE